MHEFFSISSNSLIEIWQEYFSQRPTIDFSIINQFPILIGVTISIAVGNASSSVPLPEILLIKGVLVRTNERLELEPLFNELILFKEEFNEYVRYLLSRFVQNIVSCPELVLTISEYLPLNDAVKIFSLDVLRLLLRYERKLPVIDPLKEFLDLMRTYSHLDQIKNLRIKEHCFERVIKSNISNQFPYTKSLELSQMNGQGIIRGMGVYFPQMTSLSLSYDGTVQGHKSCLIFNTNPFLIQHLTIRWHSIECPHHSPKYLFVRLKNKNTTVETFVLYISSTDQSQETRCHQNHSKCTLKTIIEFIGLMADIKNVRIITEGNIETLLDANEWVHLAGECKQLDQIKLKGKSIPSFDGTLPQTIKNALKNIRPTIDFQVQLIHSI